MLRRVIPLLLPGTVLFLLSHCDRPAVISEQIRKVHGTAATAFCSQIAECEREELRQRLKNDVQRRTYVESRMTDAACIDTQLQRIEKDPQRAELLSGCTEALRSVQGCSERLRLLREEQSCKLTLNL